MADAGANGPPAPARLADYATEPYDLLTWLGLTLLVAAGSVAACLLPAWRASRVQSAAVLHWE